MHQQQGGVLGATEASGNFSEYLSKPNLNAFLKKIDLNLSMLYQEVLAVLS